MESNNKRIDIDALKRHIRAVGWGNVLRAVCPEIAPVLDNPRKRMACPQGHSVHGDAFRMWKDDGGSVCNTCGVNSDGFATIMFVRNCAFVDAAKLIDDYLGNGSVITARPVAMAVPTRFAKDDFILAKLTQTWQQSIDGMDPQAEPLRRYFINRGLTPMPQGIPPDIRFHPALEYWEKKLDGSSVKAGEFPALIALVRQSNGDPVTLHRIYLTPDGNKAPVESPKKQMTAPSHRTVAGSAIRLTEDAPILHATEGVENALAVRNILGPQVGHAVCSCLNSVLLARIDPPAVTKIVVLWGDHDGGAGIIAVNAALQNLRDKGIRAMAMTPRYMAHRDDAKFDWNNAIQRYGVEGVRATGELQNMLRILEKESLAAGITIPADKAARS